VTTVYLVAILASGFFFKGVIVAYLKSPQTKKNPINVLIWIEQVCIFEGTPFRPKRFWTNFILQRVARFFFKQHKT
jgi:hypothetical protein